MLAAGCWLVGVCCCWLLADGHAGCGLLGVGCWLVAVGCWVLGADCWLMAVGWLLNVRCWLLGVCCCWLLAAGMGVTHNVSAHVVPTVGCWLLTA